MSIHLYLSPHLDDAALSCGGHMLATLAAGTRARVVNIFAGIPDYSHLSAYARRQHAKWGNLPDPYAARRAEDATALAAIDAEVEHWDGLDAIYRPPGGPFLYTNHDEVFGPIHPDERDYPVALAARCDALAVGLHDATWFAPLAVGGHVDHRIARDTGFILHAHGHRVEFYEDFPYAARWQEVAEVLDASHHTWQPILTAIDIEGKIALVRAYASQLTAVFGDETLVESTIRDYAAALAAGPDLAGSPKPVRSGAAPSYYERTWRIVR